MVELLEPSAFSDVDLVIASTPDEVSAEFALGSDAGAVVVDESGFWRMDPSVPLIVPEVNPEAVDNHSGIIASPNCSTTQMVVALAPLHSAAKVKRVVVSTYQATSGAGLAGNEELYESVRSELAGKLHPPRTFQHPIGFNLIPQIGSEKYQGYTSEEMKMVYETRKIMGDEDMVCPTCVRVPVTIGHSESFSWKPRNHCRLMKPANCSSEPRESRSLTILISFIPCHEIVMAKTTCLWDASGRI